MSTQFSLNKFDQLDYRDDAEAEANRNEVLVKLNGRKAEGFRQKRDLADGGGHNKRADGGKVKHLIVVSDAEYAAPL